MAIRGLRRGVNAVNPYIPGKTIEEVRRDLGLQEVIKLGSNENPYAPFPYAIKAMEEELRQLNCYPDVTFKEIKELLAFKFGLEPVNFAISHGAEGMLQTMGKCFIEDGDEVIIPETTYGLYREISKLMGAKVKTVPLTKDYCLDLKSIRQAVKPQTKLIWLCNPNNPTGTVFSKTEFHKLVTELPENTWIVLDEAYAEFAQVSLLPETTQYIKEGRQLIVIRTFSKAFGLAGARIGYAIASPEMITVIDTVSEPFNANRIGLAAATATLKNDTDYFNRSLQSVIEDRKKISKQLQIRGFKVITSHTNFVYFETPYNADELADYLLKEGVIVRSCTGWGLTKGIRVTVGTTEECDKFLEKIKSFQKMKQN